MNKPMNDDAKSLQVMAELSAATCLEDLYPVLHANRYTAGWHKKTPSLWKEPRKTYLPQHWRYREARLAMDRAGEWISTELAERRNLLMFNPVEGNEYATARSIVSAYQMIKGKEYAKTHRHTPNALRLILDTRPGVFTVVNGIKLPMNPGDVLLTPNWSWHSHYNEGEANGYWIDFLDVPLVHLLEPMFFEVQEGDTQPVTSEPAQSEFAFPQAWAEAHLARMAPDAHGVRRLVLPTVQHMPSMHLAHALIPKGGRTGVSRSTAHRIFAVMKGKGSARIGEQEFHWEFGDTLVVPGWTHFEFSASDEALLFQVNDEPLMRMLGFYRQES